MDVTDFKRCSTDQTLKRQLTHLQPVTYSLDIDTGPPTVKKVREANMKVKSGKASGIDSIQLPK